jgi:hypothetical protein
MMQNNHGIVLVMVQDFLMKAKFLQGQADHDLEKIEIKSLVEHD